MDFKYILNVIAPDGIVVRDMPGAQSEGALRLRAERRGAKLKCVRINIIQGVPYGQVINPTKPDEIGWVRIAEADNNYRYVDVIDLGVANGATETGDIATALNRIAAAIEKLGDK